MLLYINMSDSKNLWQYKSGTISRRNFLWKAAHGLMGWFLLANSWNAQWKENESKKNRIPLVFDVTKKTVESIYEAGNPNKEWIRDSDILTRVQNITPWKWNHEMLDTLLGTAQITAISRALAWIFFQWRNKSQNGITWALKLRENPIKEGIDICITGPIIEEVAFRGLMQHACKIIGINMDITVIFINSLFALSHNFKKNGDIDHQYIPLNEFIAGIYFSYLTEKKNIRHAIASHMAHNVGCLVEWKIKTVMKRRKWI